MDWDYRLELTTNTVTQCVREDAWTLTQQSTIHRKYHGKTGYLLGNVDTGDREFAGMGYHVNNVQTMQNQVAVDGIMWKSHKTITQNDHTNQSHKQIAKNNHAKQHDVMSKNGNDE